MCSRQSVWQAEGQCIVVVVERITCDGAGGGPGVPTGDVCAHSSTANHLPASTHTTKTASVRVSKRAQATKLKRRHRPTHPSSTSGYTGPCWTRHKGVE